MTERRFGFGRNWARFAKEITPQQLAAARSSLQAFTRRDDLAAMSVLDIGCGSGLFSLAALELGAERLVAFDYDPDSVATTESLLTRHGCRDRARVMHGDVLDGGFLGRLGTFDLVYSWGVLHHTGSMWNAVSAAANCVSEGGMLYIAIYNDQGFVSDIWSGYKKAYNLLPPVIRELLVLPYILLSVPVSLWRALVGHDANRGKRGMRLWIDARDWVGGYPFEVATPAAVEKHLEAIGFRLVRQETTRGHGCNEFLFQRI